MQRDPLQELLAFSALCEHVRRKELLTAPYEGFDDRIRILESQDKEQFDLDEVLHLVSHRAGTITRADGVAIALAENNEIVLRAAAGSVRPDVGARIESDSAISGACLRTAQVVNCDDTETDQQVNAQACRRLGARSVVAVPLRSQRGVIGLLESFSTWPFAFSDKDVRNLSRLAELVVDSLKPEEQERLAEFALAAAATLNPVPVASADATPGTVPVLDESEVSAPNQDDVGTKDEEFETTFAPATSVAIQSGPEPQNALPGSDPREALAERKSRLPRPRMPILLVGVGVVAAIAAVIWWNIRTGGAKARKETVQTAKVALESAKPHTIDSTARPSLKAKAIAHANATAVSGASRPSPAIPQEFFHYPHVTGIQHWSSEDSSTVVLDLEDQVQYEAHRLTAPDRLYIDLRETQLGPALSPWKEIAVSDDAQLRHIRVAQPVVGTTRIVLVTKAAPGFTVSLQPNPYRLVIEVRASPRAR